MKLINILTHHPRRFALVLAVLAFIFYASSTPRFNVDYGDSDEFLSVGQTWGLAHPPGFILYVTVLHCAMQLPLPGTTTTQRAHLVSGLSAALSLYFLTLFLFLIIKPIARNNRSQPWLVPVSILVTIIALATSKLFWLYAQISEKYLFSAPFITAIMYLLIKFHQTHPKFVRQIFLVSFLFGLLVTHLEIMFLLFPYLIYVLYDTKVITSIKYDAALVGGTLAGLILPQLLILFRAIRLPLISWSISPNIPGVLNFIRQANLQSTVYPSLPSFSAGQFLSGIYHYFLISMNSFSWWIIVPLFLGIVELCQHHRRFFFLFSFPYLLIGLILSAYFGWPSDLNTQALTSRLYIPSFVTLTPLLCYGLYEFLRRLIKSMKIVGLKSNQCALYLSILSVSVPLVIAVISYRSLALNSFNLASSLYTEILDQVQPNSILTCYSNNSCFPLIYEQTVNHRRLDVDVIPSEYALVSRQTIAKKLSHFNYSSNPFYLFDVVTWNMGKRPIYAVDLSQNYFNFFGLNYGFMDNIPEGYAGRLDRSEPQNIPPYNTSLSDTYTHTTIPRFDLTRRFLVQSLANTHFNNAYLWLKIGDRSRARTELDLAVNLSYQLTDTEKQNSSETRTFIERTLTDQNSAPGSHVIDAKTLLSYMPDLNKPHLDAHAYAIALGAITIDPANVEAHLTLAQVYASMKNFPSATKEYENVLLLDPTNQEAKMHLNQSAPL